MEVKLTYHSIETRLKSSSPNQPSPDCRLALALQRKMPTASEGFHRVRGNGWTPFASVKRAPRRLPVHVSLEERPSLRGGRLTDKAGPSAFHPITAPAFNLSWESMLRHLIHYVEREGHARVPLNYEFKQLDEHGYEVDGRCIRLGVWLSKQWAEWQAGRLSHNRAERLAAVGVDWYGSAPPATGAVGSHHMNERKWDPDQSTRLAMQHVRRPFDTSKPAEQPHWAEYDATRDPHTRRWRKQHGVSATQAVQHPPRLIQQYGSGNGTGMRTRGLPPELGVRLQHAHHQLMIDRRAMKPSSNSE